MTERTTTLLAEHATALSVRADALSSGRVFSLVETLMASTDTDVLDFHAAAVEVLKLAEAAVVAASGEVARRSESSLPDPLARRLGEKSAGALLAARTPLADADAAGHCKLGLAVSPREGLTGEILPPFFSEVADAVASGALTNRAARVIVATLERIEPHASAEQLASVETALVHGAATGWAARTLADVCRVAPDRFDPDGVEPREAAIRARRGARRRMLDDGTIQWVLNFDAEGAAYFEAAIDARTAPRRQVRFTDPDDSDPTSASNAVDDRRTLEQKRLDALIDIARDSLRGDDGTIGGVDTTAVLHIPLDAVTDGTGSAWFEGIETPVSATTARRALACAEIVGLVLDGEGQPLKLGSTHRYFSAGQRRAMAARDRGCLWPGCTAPPRWCDGAHIDPWVKSKRTDISNGFLLCHFHHRRFDEDGWSFHRDRQHQPWFTPPAHIDASRTPRRGGRTAEQIDTTTLTPKR